MAAQAIFRNFILLAPFGCLAACAAPAAQTVSETSYTLPDTQTLKGSTAQVLSADFGQPLIRRVDGPAQVWLYHSQVCGLDVFLYPDSNGVPRVAAAVPDNGDPVSCMQSLARPGITSAALERPAAS